MLDAFGTLGIATCRTPMPRLSETEAWIKPFRRQVAITCGDGWYVRNNRGKMRLNVPGHGTLSLNYDWSERGATQALPFIQQLFKRWNGGQVTLAAAATSTSTSSSHQKLDFKALIEKYRAFVPNAGDTTWKTFYLPVLRNCAKAFKDRPPVDGEALAMQCLAQWEQGSRMRQTSRQKLYGFLNWAVQRGHLKPIYAPPATLPETLKPKRIGYPLSDAQILQLLDNFPGAEAHDHGGLPFNSAPYTDCALRNCGTSGWGRGKRGRLWTIYQKSMGGTKGAKTEPRRLHPLLLRDSRFSH